MFKFFRVLGLVGVVMLGGGGSVYCADVEIELGKKDGELQAVVVPERGLDMGDILPEAKKSMKLLLKNTAGEDIKVESWRSPCTCLYFEGTVDVIADGSKKEVSVTLDGENYRGAFTKYMFMSFSNKNGSLTKTFFLPIKFSISEDAGQAVAASTPDKTPQKDARIKFVNYEGGGLEKYKGVTGWIFAGKACPSCNFLKSDLLPKLLDSESIEKAEIVLVDLDKKENFIFMVELEGKLGVKGDKTPVLYWKEKLYYGNDKIKELISGGNNP